MLNAAGLRDKLRQMTNPSRRTFRIVLASLGLLALAWQQVQATRLGYRVEAARKQALTLRGRIGAMQMQLQSDLSPAQLALQARTRLGMLPASPEALRLLDDAGARVPDSFLSRLLSRTWRSLTASLAT
jgi:hypothetical protein